MLLIILKCTMCFHLYVESKKTEQAKQKHSETDQKDGYQKEGGEGAWTGAGECSQFAWWQTITGVSGVITLEGIKMSNHYIVPLELIYIVYQLHSNKS